MRMRVLLFVWSDFNILYNIISLYDFRKKVCSPVWFQLLNTAIISGIISLHA